MKAYQILNLGAGVQSTTIALMGIKNWEYWACSEPLPYPVVGLIDFAIFADTQEEPRAVYAHLEWLKKQCERWFPIMVRTVGKLGDYLIRGAELTNRDLKFEEDALVAIPAYTLDPDGNRGIIPRHCTKDYKVDVLDRTIRREILGLPKGSRIPLGTEVEQLMGLSYDEPGRIIRTKQRETLGLRFRFPLFDMEMSRAGCKTWLKKQNIPHEVPRSACVFCPYHSNSEWRNIKEVPEDWARAVEIDDAIRDRRRKSLPYVHKDCVPLSQADLDDPETKERKKGQEMFGFLQECEGMCGV